jgi:hypothetical protein
VQHLCDPFDTRAGAELTVRRADDADGNLAAAIERVDTGILDLDMHAARARMRGLRQQRCAGQQRRQHAKRAIKERAVAIADSRDDSGGVRHSGSGARIDESGGGRKQ